MGSSTSTTDERRGSAVARALSVLGVLAALAALFVVVPLVRQHHQKSETRAEHWPNGQVKTLGDAIRNADGKLIFHGHYTSYYESGAKESEGRYDHGVRVGPWSWWYEDGRRLGACNYDEGVGEYHSWHENGEDWREGQYDHGHREGEWTEWWPSGRRRMEGSFVDDAQDGVWTYWTDSDSPDSMTVRWHKGERVR